MFSIRKFLIAWLCVPIIAFSAAEDVHRQPLNMFMISQYGAANKVASDELKSALQEQNFVILCDDSIVEGQPGFKEAMAAASGCWYYFHNNELNFVLCVGKQESRSLNQMGFDELLWMPIDNILTEKMASRSIANLASRFSKMFKADRRPQDFFLFMLGHGTSSYIAGMPIEEYKEFLSVLEAVGTRFLGIASCYAGGINSQVSVNERSRPTFPIAIYCAGDVIGLGDCSISLSRLFGCLNEQFKAKKLLTDEQDLVAIIKNSYKEQPYLFNLPILYVPGNSFFNAVAIKDVVAINDDNHSTTIAVPENCRAVQVKTPSLQGAIIDDSSPYILPFVSRIPGNATHELSALFRNKAKMSTVISSFFPSTFLIHESSGSRFEAIKLWLCHGLISLDRQLASCAIWFDGTDTCQKGIVLAKTEQGSYGMMQFALSTKGITDAKLTDSWIPLKRLEYARMIIHLCESAKIDQKVVRAMGLQDVDPEQIAKRFLQLEDFDLAALEEAKNMDVESVFNKDVFTKIREFARCIKTAENQKDFHNLWRVYFELDELINGNKDIAPSVIAALFEAGFEQVALFCAQWLGSEVAKQTALLCEGRHKALLENLRSPEKATCSLLPDVIDPLSHLHCITLPQQEEDRFLKALSSMADDKRYEDLFAILSNLLPKQHEPTIADNFLICNWFLNLRRRHIVGLIKSNKACYDLFCSLIVKLFNSADAAEREKAKVFIARVSISPDRLLGIVSAITTDSAISEGKFLFSLLEKESKDLSPSKHSLFTALANKIDEYYKYADRFDGDKIRDLFYRLPFSCKPLGTRIHDEKGGTLEEERAVLAEYAQKMMSNPREAVKNYVTMIPWEYSQSDTHSRITPVMHQRIRGITAAILTAGDWRTMLEQVFSMVVQYSDSLKSIVYLIQQHGSGEQQDAIKEWLKAHGK